MSNWHALWQGPVLNPRLERQVNIERIVVMARQQPVAALAHALNSTVLAVSAWQSVPHGFLITTLSLFLLGAIWVFYIWWSHRGRSRPAKVRNRTIDRAVFWAWGFGALWGIYCAALFFYGDLGIKFLTSIVIAGMAAGATFMLFSIPAAVVGFLFLISTPSLVLSFMSGQAVLETLGVFALIYFGFLYAAARNGYASFVEGVHLRMENAELAEMAEAASRAKSRFLANVSHELRTPLNTIIGFAEVMDGQYHGPIGAPEYGGFIRSILNSSRHLVGVINDVLDLSKVESGRFELEDCPVELKKLVEEATEIIRPDANRHRLSLDITEHGGSWEVFVDPIKFRQILLNLLSNAVKFTGDGGKVSLATSMTKDGGIKVTVTDTGTGIPEEELEAVLKPFVQSKYSALRQVSGTGLGLSLAKQLIELHGGTLHLASTVGVGTIVTLQLPSARVVEADRARAAE